MKEASIRGKIQLTLLRIIVYTILVFLTVLCLFFFYLMIINATRSNAQLATGFTLLPKGNFFVNLKNAWNDASIASLRSPATTPTCAPTKTARCR